MRGRVFSLSGAVVALLFAVGSAGASDRPAPYAGLPVLSDQELDAQRGGVDLGYGIQVSFGIENLVFVNGELVSRTTLQIDDAALTHLNGIVQVVRDGLNVGASAGATDLAVATVIQNSLNSQLIQSLSVLDASVAGLEFVRSLRMDDLFGRSVFDVP